MNIHLLKTRIQGLKLFKDGHLDLDLITIKKVTSPEIDEHIVEHLFGSVYKQNILALAGVNASGKTTVLKLVTIMLELFIQNKSLDSVSNNEVLEHLEDKCTFINTFYSENKVFELTSMINRNDNGKLEFQSEILKIKEIKSNTSKEKLFNFEGITPDRTREDIEKLAMGYLRGDTSIFMQVLKEAGVLNGTRYIYDMTQYTNFNIFGTLSTIPAGYVRYLDPDIEEIEFLNPENSHQYSKLFVKIKFYNQDVREISVIDLWKYLSSGTIKGLNLLLAIEKVLKTGGYMVIDEIENHLNKTVAITLLNLFKSEINSNNATLIFSTHYSEILDDIDRSDSVYFSTKTNGLIELTNLSSHSTRSDKKKSNIYLSGLLGTAPKYKGYLALKESLKRNINQTSDAGFKEA
ncbi:MAG: AAA family ATPase [Bacillota bacterium]